MGLNWRNQCSVKELYLFQSREWLGWYISMLCCPSFFFSWTTGQSLRNLVRRVYKESRQEIVNTCIMILTQRGLNLGVVTSLRCVKLFTVCILLQNYRTNFNQTWHKASLDEGNAALFNWRVSLFPRGDN